MQTKRSNLNLKNFKRWCRENRELARTVLIAQANAELTRQKVDGYIDPVFQSFGFVYEGNAIAQLDKRNEEKLAGKPIPSQHDFYFCLLHGKDESEELQAKIREYYEACQVAHREHGYGDLPFGHCPALTAEHLLVQAQGALIDSAEAVTGIDRSAVAGGEKWNKYLALLIGGIIAESPAFFNTQFTPDALRQWVERKKV